MYNRLYFSVSRQDYDNRHYPGTIGYKIFQLLEKYGTIKLVVSLYSDALNINKVGVISAIDTKLEKWMLNSLKIENINLEYFVRWGDLPEERVVVE